MSNNNIINININKYENCLIGFPLDIVHFNNKNLIIILKDIFNNKICVEVVDFKCEIYIDNNYYNDLILFNSITKLKLNNIDIFIEEKYNLNHELKRYKKIQLSSKNDYKNLKKELINNNVNTYMCDIYKLDSTTYDFINNNNLDASICFYINNYQEVQKDYYTTTEKNVKNITKEEHDELFKKGYIKLNVIEFDIETLSNICGQFPNENNDEDVITTISFTEYDYHYKYNNLFNNNYKSSIYTFYNSDIIKKQDLIDNEVSIFKRFKDEKSMIQSIYNIICKKDIIIDFNGSEFDLPYILKRLQKNKLNTMNNFPTFFQTVYNVNTKKNILKKIYGIIHYDMYKAFTARDAPKLSENNLKYIAMKFLFCIIKEKIDEETFKCSKFKCFKGMEIIHSIKEFDEFNIINESSFRIYYVDNNNDDYTLIKIKPLLLYNKINLIKDEVNYFNIIKNDVNHTEMHRAYKYGTLNKEHISLLNYLVEFNSKNNNHNEKQQDWVKIDKYLDYIIDYSKNNNIDYSFKNYNVDNNKNKIDENKLLLMKKKTLENVKILYEDYLKLENKNYNNISYFDEVAKNSIIYCINDTRILTLIQEKRMALISLQEKGHLRKCLFLDSCSEGNSFLNQFTISKKCIEMNYIIPSKISNQDFINDKYKGATVLDSNAGLYGLVACVDFSSLYPSIIRAFNICRTTIYTKENKEKSNYNDDDFNYFNVDGEDLYFIKQKHRKGVFPELCENFTNERKKVKKLLEDSDDPTEKMILDIKQANIKIGNNSVYGTAGDQNSTHFDKRIASSITTIGRYYLNLTKDFVENYPLNKKKIIFKVIGGDTDSNFILVENCDNIEEAYYQLKIILDEFNKQLPPPMNLELEKFYNPLLLIGKKRRIGKKIEISEKNDKLCFKNSLESKGSVVQKRDIPLIIKNLEKDLFEIILNNFNNNKNLLINNIKNYLYKYINNFENQQINNFLIIKSLKNENDYSSDAKNPNIILAKKLKKENKIQNIQSGDKISYVYVKELKDNIYEGDKIMRIEEMIENNYNLDFDKYRSMAFDLVLINIYKELFNKEDFNNISSIFKVNIIKNKKLK